MTDDTALSGTSGSTVTSDGSECQYQYQYTELLLLISRLFVTHCQSSQQQQESRTHTGRTTQSQQQERQQAKYQLERHKHLNYHINAEKLITISQSRLPLRIYCDRPDHLNPGLLTAKSQYKIELVTDIGKADVLYLIDHFASESQLQQQQQQQSSLLPSPPSSASHSPSLTHTHSHTHSPSSTHLQNEWLKTNKLYTNQFWWNGYLVTKEQLVKTVTLAHRKKQLCNTNVTGDRKNDRNFPVWLPCSYDLGVRTDLAACV